MFYQVFWVTLKGSSSVNLSFGATKQFLLVFLFQLCMCLEIVARRSKDLLRVFFPPTENNLITNGNSVFPFGFGNPRGKLKTLSQKVFSCTANLTSFSLAWPYRFLYVGSVFTYMVHYQFILAIFIIYS